MAEFFFECGFVSRSGGRSKSGHAFSRNTIAKAAYDSRDKLTDRRTGEVYDYRYKGLRLLSAAGHNRGAPPGWRDREVPSPSWRLARLGAPGTGEKANWNGAKPVADELSHLRADLAEAVKLLAIFSHEDYPGPALGDQERGRAFLARLQQEKS